MWDPSLHIAPGVQGNGHSSVTINRSGGCQRRVPFSPDKTKLIFKAPKHNIFFTSHSHCRFVSIAVGSVRCTRQVNATTGPHAAPAPASPQPPVPEPSPPQLLAPEPSPPQHQIDAVTTIAGIFAAVLTGILLFLLDFGLQEGKEAVAIGGGVLVLILLLSVVVWVAKYNGLLRRA